MMSRFLLIAGFYCIIPLAGMTQDPVFSQFYHSPLYTNPAFTGCGKNDFRANLTSRVQWMNLPTPMQFHTISADKYFSDYNVSSGVVLNRFDEGYIKTTETSMIAAKNFGSDGYDGRQWFFNFAMQFGFTFRNVDKSKLLFADQLTQNGPNGLSTQAELFQFANKAYFDVSSGFLFTYGNFMFGASGHHLSQPHNGLISSSNESRLPRRFSFHLSLIKNDYLESDGALVIKPTLIVNAQGTSRSLMAGSLFDMPDRNIEFGIWYRNNWGLQNDHSISIGMNIKFGKEKDYYNGEGNSRFRTGISYDAEINRPGVRHTSGSSEIGILYEAGNETCPKPSGSSGVRFPWEFH